MTTPLLSGTTNMGRIVLLLIAVLAVAAVRRKPAPRLYGGSPDAFAFPTSAAHAGVDLDDPVTVAEWRRRFECDEDQLRAAIKVVGNNPEAVRRHLMRTR